MEHPHSIYCILPPYLLKSIAKNGTPAQRYMALRTIASAEQMRKQRETVKEAAEKLTTPAAVTGKQRNVYDAKHGSSLPGILARKEGDPPSGDLAVDEAYDGSGSTYDLYLNKYARNSLDNNGMPLNSTVHFQISYDNAFWDGQRMVYGDGDEDLPPEERIFNRFTIAVDVIGHELTHGVIQHEANLAYWQQSGALNESFADVFGSLVKQYQKSELAAQADWLIGEGLFTANVNAFGLRSMKAPGTAYNDPLLGKDPQPAHMNDFVVTVEDNGGVHINSGIPNHAFYVTAMQIGGYAWEKAGRIWYKTLTDKLGPTPNFQAAANATHAVAGDLYGPNSLEQVAVRTGWAAVGITVDGGETSPGCLASVLKLLGLAGTLEKIKK